MHLKQLFAAGLCGVLLAGPIGIAPVLGQTATQSGMQSGNKGATQKHAAQPTTSSTPATGLVNVNTATPAELDALPQIGEKRSAKIIKNRPYKTIDELVTKKALSKGIFEKIKDKITT